MRKKKSKMGRPKKFDNGTTMSFDLDKTTYEKIETVAKELNQTKSDFIRFAIESELSKHG